MDDYPLLGLFWTMLWFFFFVAWISVIFTVFRDIYASSDLSGWAKAGWTFLIFVLPWLGVLVYLVARGGKMRERQVESFAAQERVFADYVHSVASSPPSTADELTKLGNLRAAGVLTDAEFAEQKAVLLQRAVSAGR
ncbi:SHOCT domain-containing protein [Sanguibacter sp. 25GB23B1]|uniref:SHOCT domain-containing protein n=1 Tax=unclassified Sanguibacter TaxID=2645534 RepID=UPI0032AFED6B